MLVLTGGDPFKRPDIFELVEAAAGAGLKVSMTPSATPLVTYGAIRRLRDAGVSRIAISLDGATAAAHDASRGVQGSFARTLDILAFARALEISTQVNTTVHRGNLQQIEAMADLLAIQQIDLWSVFFLVPVGRVDPAMRLTGAQCEEAFAALWREAQRRPFAIKTTEAPHYRRYVVQQQRQSIWEDPPLGSRRPARAFSNLGINDGKGILFISHHGLIFPSGFLPIECGSFPQDRVVDVYQNSPIFRALRNPGRLEGKCGACEFRRLCGGSRARAYAVTGDAFAQEPDCEYIPNGWR